MLRCRTAFVGISIALAPLFAVGEDFFLTIGGGSSPDSNQVSLEKNVQFFQRVLAQHRPDGPKHQVLFADGRRGDRDLQFRGPKKSVPKASRILSEVLGQSSDWDIRYRDHQIEGPHTAATANNLQHAMERLAAQLVAGDRLVIYFAGHGGEPDEEDRPHNTTLALWDYDTVTQSEFTAWLDGLDAGVEVTLVMVQCYSGGFAHTIFHGGEQSLGLAPRPRCGFFSQTHNREAAGCTPDIDESEYQEYSSFFWAAIAGSDRTGRPTQNADFDGDGRVCFAEAHAYAVIYSETIDVPIRTSEALLWRYSRVGEGQPEEEQSEESSNPMPSFQDAIGALLGGGEAGEAEAGEDELAESDEGRAHESSAPEAGPLLPLAGSLLEIADLARPEQRAVLTELPARIGLESDTTIEGLRDRLRLAGDEVESKSDKYDTAYNVFDASRIAVEDALLRRWPELYETYPAQLVSLLGEGAEGFASEVRALGCYQTLVAAKRALLDAAEELSEAENRQAALRRVLRTCRAVVLEQNLPQTAPEAVVEHFHRLMELENGDLSGSAR